MVSLIFLIPVHGSTAVTSATQCLPNSLCFQFITSLRGQSRFAIPSSSAKLSNIYSTEVKSMRTESLRSEVFYSMRQSRLITTLSYDHQSYGYEEDKLLGSQP